MLLNVIPVSILVLYTKFKTNQSKTPNALEKNRSDYCVVFC